MVEKSQASEDIELGVFLQAAGQSFAEAQKALAPGLGVSVNMMLSNAELELKVAVGSDAKGNVVIKPISSKDLTRGGIDSGMLSTLRINYVSTVGELKSTVAEPAVPRMKLADVITAARTKLNIDKLEKTAGKLEVKPSYVPEKNRWLVTVENARGKVIKETVLPDTVKETRSAKPTG